jgi:hypothetical protein
MSTKQGCHIFLGTTHQQIYKKITKIYQLATKYTKWDKNRPNGRKIYQHLELQDNPKFTQSGIFGLKIYHQPTQRRSMKVIKMPT